MLRWVGRRAAAGPVPWSGQKPQVRSSSKLAEVEHQAFPSLRPSLVQRSYFLPRKVKGKTQGAPFPFPPIVDMAVESGARVGAVSSPSPPPPGTAT